MNNQTLTYIKEKIARLTKESATCETRLEELEQQENSHRKFSTIDHLTYLHGRYEAMIDACEDILKECKSDDVIYYRFWSRDCDMCESTSVGWLHTEEDLEEQKRLSGENADGPFSYTVLTKAEYNEIVDNPIRNRDRISEAHENGNGSNIYV